MSLAEVRAQIDRVDAKILRLLGARARLVAEAWAIKEAQGTPAIDPEREAEILAQLQALALTEGLNPADVLRIWQEIVRVRPAG